MRIIVIVMLVLASCNSKSNQTLSSNKAEEAAIQLVFDQQVDGTKPTLTSLWKATINPTRFFSSEVESLPVGIVLWFDTKKVIRIKQQWGNYDLKSCEWISFPPTAVIQKEKRELGDCVWSYFVNRIVILRRESRKENVGPAGNVLKLRDSAPDDQFSFKIG